MCHDCDSRHTHTQVSWVKREPHNDNLQLLTVGMQTYSGDSRFSVEFQYPNNWRLRIDDANKSDEGQYECQISTYPPRVITTYFQVNCKFFPFCCCFFSARCSHRFYYCNFICSLRFVYVIFHNKIRLFLHSMKYMGYENPMQLLTAGQNEIQWKYCLFNNK